MRAIIFNWETNDCIYALAQLYSRRGDKELAFIDYQKVVELDSSKALAYLELGILNKELSNDHETTLSYLNRSIAYGILLLNCYQRFSLVITPGIK